MKRLLCFVIWLLLLLSVFAEEESYFEVHYLDVGQGNAEIIICDGEVLLIDGGPRGANQLIYSYLTNTLHISYIDFIISTHPDADHVSGIVSALTACDAGVIYSPVLGYDTKTFESMVEYADRQGVDIVIPGKDLEFDLGSATVRILGPVCDYADSNKKSLVTRVTYGDTAFLFMGDADRDVENDLMEAGYALEADVLLIGCHGSDTATGSLFLRSVGPQFAVISVGKDNGYGHPNERTLYRIESAGVPILRTDLDGHIICRSDGKRITVETAGKRR